MATQVGARIITVPGWTGQPRTDLALIDCDVHQSIKQPEDLHPYLPRAYRQQAIEQGIRFPGSGYFNVAMDAARTDLAKVRPPASRPIAAPWAPDVVGLLRDEKVEVNADSLAAARRWVESAMRREMARRYGGDEEAYRIALQDDDQVKQAAALLDRAPSLPKLLALADEINREKAMEQNRLDAKSVR